MKGLRHLLLEEQFRLENIIRETKPRLENAPVGRLRLSKSHNHVQYYCCTEERKSGEYLSKENQTLIQQLAQKSYDEKILRLAEKRILQIKKLVHDYVDDELEKIYLEEHLERQKLIIPVEPTWEQRLNEWKAKEYAGKGFYDNAPIILTEKGERVRSKSEKIMADYFYKRGIEYKYECPLYLKGLGIVHPDFTLLSKKNNEEIYWEHNGKCDDAIYAKNMVKKINAYEDNGIYPGERLILTYETEQTILNTNKIEQLVQKYL
jgi:hypothetical protein